MQPDLFAPVFDYSHVDGIGRARQRAIEPRLPSQLRADPLGPIIEFGNLHGAGGLQALCSSTWFDEGSRASFFRALFSAEGHWVSADRSCGIIKGETILSDDKLNSFKIDAHQAALAVGFGKATSLLIAALGELIGNVEDHSEDVSTGTAVFLAKRGHFEFVVADQGIGALASLRKSPEYFNLSDDGAALAEMIESGVSRFGRNQGHGNGFRPIFERLADMTGQLRFRSGDQALSLDGRFGDRIGRQLAQKPRMKGFLAAVLCHAPPMRTEAFRL